MVLQTGMMQMQVKVRFFTSLREIVGKREITQSFPEREKVTVYSVLMVLAEKYGKPFQDYVYVSGTAEPKGFLQFLVNGNSTSILDGLKTELRNGDVLAILPPVGGG